MDRILGKIADMITRHDMIAPGGKVLAAVSGGADSVCLLIALQELGYQVSAVHVEHGIRGEESLADCDFTQALCAEREIPLTVRHIDAPALARAKGLSLEEAARCARMEIFLETASSRGISAVAAAHNQGDQAETVLWNLARGSSLAGLRGIPPVRILGGTQESAVRLVRPLLTCSRQEIEAYLTQRRQSWRIDRTNLDTDITRNAVRLQVLPQLERINAGAQEHIAQAASDLARTEAYLEEETDRYYAQAVRAGAILTHEAAGIPDVIRSRVVYRAVCEAAGGAKDITREHVRSAERLLEMENGHRISLPGGLLAVREEGAVRFVRAVPEGIREEVILCADGDYCFPGPDGGQITVHVRYGVWDGPEVPKKKYTKMLAYDTMAPYICLRTRREGDYLVVNSGGGRRKLKDHMIDVKLPRDRRDRIPLIVQGSHVLWVIGGRISEDAKVRAGVPYIGVTVTGPECTDQENAGGDL